MSLALAAYIIVDNQLRLRPQLRLRISSFGCVCDGDQLRLHVLIVAVVTVVMVVVVGMAVGTVVGILVGILVGDSK